MKHEKILKHRPFNEVDFSRTWWMYTSDPVCQFVTRAGIDRRGIVFLQMAQFHPMDWPLRQGCSLRSSSRRNSRMALGCIPGLSELPCRNFPTVCEFINYLIITIINSTHYVWPINKNYNMRFDVLLIKKLPIKCREDNQIRLLSRGHSGSEQLALLHYALPLPTAGVLSSPSTRKYTGHNYTSLFCSKIFDS